MRAIFSRLKRSLSRFLSRVRFAIAGEVSQYFVGCDLGKKVDYSAVALVAKRAKVAKLTFIKRFPLETPYASVIGFIKILSVRFNPEQILVDQTGVGEYVVEDMKSAGLPNVEGLMLTMQMKEEILGYMKQQMQNCVEQCGNQKCNHPRLFQLPYDNEVIAEINLEKFELTKDGHIKFSHPEGTHDDRLWAIALAVYASRESEAPAFIPIRKR
jgi:phage FluMu gp28-like protein